MHARLGKQFSAAMWYSLIIFLDNFAACSADPIPKKYNIWDIICHILVRDSASWRTVRFSATLPSLLYDFFLDLLHKACLEVRNLQKLLFVGFGYFSKSIQSVFSYVSLEGKSMSVVLERVALQICEIG